MIADIIWYILGGLGLAALVAARIYEVEEQRRDSRPPKDKDDNTRS